MLTNAHIHMHTQLCSCWSRADPRLWTHVSSHVDSDTHTHTDPENTMPTAPQSPALTRRHTCKTPKPTTLPIPPDSRACGCAPRQRWLALHGSYAHTPWGGPAKGESGPWGGRGNGSGPWHSSESGTPLNKVSSASEPRFPSLQVLTYGQRLWLWGARTGRAWALVNRAC